MLDRLELLPSIFSFPKWDSFLLEANVGIVIDCSIPSSGGWMYAHLCMCVCVGGCGRCKTRVWNCLDFWVELPYLDDSSVYLGALSFCPVLLPTLQVSIQCQMFQSESYSHDYILRVEPGVNCSAFQLITWQTAHWPFLYTILLL